MPSSVRVIVYDTQIHAMFQPGGPVYEEARESAQEVLFLARLDINDRSGRLSSSLRIASETRASRRTVGFYIRADAPHARWVHEGTYGPITPTTFPNMRVPVFPELGPRGTSPKMFRRAVAGQPGQDYLMGNLRYVMGRVAR